MIPTKQERHDLLFEIRSILKINESESCEEGETSFFHKQHWLRTQPMRRLLAAYTPHEIVCAMQEVQSHWYGCDCMTINDYSPAGNASTPTARKKPIRVVTLLAVLRSMREHGYWECPALEQTAGISREDSLRDAILSVARSGADANTIVKSIAA